MAALPYDSFTINLTTMSELTKEHFERVLTEKLAPLATKQGVHEGVEELARMTSDGFARMDQRFDEVDKRLDFSEQIKTFELKFKKLEEALHIKL